MTHSLATPRDGRRLALNRLLPAVLALAAGNAFADATGTWLVNETGVKFDTTLSKIPLFGKILGTNAARENVVWLIDREGDNYVIRIPERDVLITVPFSADERISGGTGAAQVDLAVDADTFTGTLVLVTENNQANKNSVNESDGRKLVYELDGRLTAVSARVRETAAKQLEQIRSLESAAADADAARRGLQGEISALEQRAAQSATALAGTRENLDARERTIETLQGELAAARERADDLAVRLNSLSAEADSDRAGHAAALEHIEARVRSLATELESASARAAQAEAERDRTRETLAALETTSAEAADRAGQASAALESRVESLEARNTALEQQLGDALAETEQLHEQVAAREESLESLRASTALEIDALKQRNASLEGDNATLAALVAELERRLAGDASTMSEAAQ